MSYSNDELTRRIDRLEKAGFTQANGFSKEAVEKAARGEMQAEKSLGEWMEQTGRR